jgi:Domain of unknown function (DUF4232)
MRRRVDSLVVAAASVGVLAVAVLVAPATSLGVTAPHCNSSQLSLKFVSFQGATGHRFWQFALKNNGAKCSLHGFSRAQLLAANGHVITSAFHHETGFPVNTVTVAHGKRAFVAITYVDGAFCTAHFHAPKVKIFPPGNAAGFVFNMVPKNMGTPFICTGSEGVFPVTSHPGP